MSPDDLRPYNIVPFNTPMYSAAQVADALESAMKVERDFEPRHASTPDEIIQEHEHKCYLWYNKIAELRGEA